MVVDIAVQSGTTVAGSGPGCSGLHPGSAERSSRILSKLCSLSHNGSVLTLSLDNLIDLGLLLARVHLLIRENSELGAQLRPSELVLAVIHGALQGIAFPTEYVVRMLTDASATHNASLLFSIVLRAMIQGLTDHPCS